MKREHVKVFAVQLLYKTFSDKVKMTLTEL